MKKVNASRLLAWAMILAIPVWLGSCKKGDDPVSPTTSAVVGSWKISGYKIDPAADVLQTGQTNNDLLAVYKQLPIGADIVDCLTTSTFTFSTDSKVSKTASSKCTLTTDISPIKDNSTWKMDGSKLTITNGTNVATYDAVVSGSSLKISYPKSEDFDGDGKSENYTYTLELTKV